MSTFVVTAAALALAAPVSSKAIIAPQSITQRVATSDVVALGKVTALDEKTVKAERFPGQMAEFRIATVKIDQHLYGAKGLTHIKVGFVPPMAPRPGEVRPHIRPYPGTAIKLEKGQEVLLFLKKHPKENFYTIPMYFDVVDKKTAGFDEDLVEAKKYGKLLADPMAGLKAKSAEDRFQAAALLVYRYRTFQQGGKQEPISADESKLILEGLAGADWNAMPVRRPGPYRQVVTPQNVFFMLGIQAKDGFAPVPGQPTADAVKAWIKANAGTYRIQRYVAAKAEK
jgi:hypothetical protein